METFPSQEIPIQQSPIQTASAISSNPVQEQSQGKRSLRKFFNLSSWFVFFALLPVTVLILISQNTVPGDLFYPVKRSLENVVLAAASVTPATRAAFRTDLTEARFKEAQSLVVSKSNTSGLITFIDEVQSINLEVASLKNDTEKKKAEEKLIAKIDQYQNGLSNLQSKTEQNVSAYQSLEIPTPTLLPAGVKSDLGGGPPTVTVTLVPTSMLLPSSQSKPFPSSTPTKVPSSTSAQTFDLTSAPTPTLVPTQAQQPESAKIEEQKKIATTIKETKLALTKIKKDLEEKRQEMKENHEKIRDEKEKSEKPNKEDSEIFPH